MQNPLDLVWKAVTGQHPRICLVVGTDTLSFRMDERSFATKAILYVEGNVVAAIGDPPLDGKWTERVDAMDGNDSTTFAMEKIISHSFRQIFGQGAFLRPVLQIQFKGARGATAAREYWQRVAIRAKALRVEFA